MALPQIVLDTSVVVAGLISHKGPSYRLLELVGTDLFVTNLSVPLALEYEAVLRRKSEMIGLTFDEVTAVVRYFCKVARKCSISYLWRPFLNDADDDMVLEVAVAASADAIITFNTRDFAGCERFGLDLLTPAQFLRQIGARA